MKAIELGQLNVKCDTCDYRVDDVNPADISDYHKLCPKCGKQELLTAAEVAMIRGILSVSGFINRLVGEQPDDSPTASVIIDSAPDAHDERSTD